MNARQNSGDQRGRQLAPSEHQRCVMRRPEVPEVRVFHDDMIIIEDERAAKGVVVRTQIHGDDQDRDYPPHSWTHVGACVETSV